MLALLAAHSLGSEFLPHLEEGNLWIRASMPPSISLEAGDSYVNRMRRIIKSYPEVETVVSQHGRPDDGTDATGFFNAEFFAPLKPFDQWPSGVDKAKLVSDLTNRLQALLPTNREALLLTAVEGFTNAETAKILDWNEKDVEDAVGAALKSIDHDLESRVLIIEDETIIALDIENLVTEMGHKVTGIATTRDDAIRMAKEQKPDIILTGIQLAAGSSSEDAAVAILCGKSEVSQQAAMAG